MDSEKVPLIKQEGEKLNHRRGTTTDEDENEDLNLRLLGKKDNNYASVRIHSIIGEHEKIKFSWSELNVFTLQRTARKKADYLKFWKEHKEQFEGKQILKNINGVAYPGELLAILGSSGAGKTTLLNTLTGRTSSQLVVTGLRCVNNIPISAKKLTGILAYVQQDDLFIGSLTVKEHLIFQARVRMDRHLSFKQRMERVEEVIKQLGLTECVDTLIGIKGRIKGISGGEMKRLSFAAEVLTNPSLMFCDEPTSGLDSFMALNVVQVLSNLAHSGKTIICTIHQPSSELFAMFDKLMLMAEGRVAFLGTSNEAVTFFTSLEAPCPYNYNPADHYIQVLSITPKQEESCRQAVNMICDKFASSEVGVKIQVEAANVDKLEYNNYFEFLSNGSQSNQRYKASWWAQFTAVLWRSWLSLVKDPIIFRARLLQTIVIAVIISIVYFGQVLNQDGIMNINGAIFIGVTNLTFQNCIAVISVFCSELPIFLREHKNGMYRVDVYFLSKTLAELPLFIIVPVLFTSITYFAIGLNADASRFFTAVGISIAVTNVASSFGYLVSAISNSTSTAFAISAPLLIPFMLFGGFFLNVVSIPGFLKWLSYLSWFRYGNEALMINQWSGVENIGCTNTSVTCTRTGEAVLQIDSFSADDLSLDVIGLCALIVGFRLLTYIVLLIKSYGRN